MKNFKYKLIFFSIFFHFIYLSSYCNISIKGVLKNKDMTMGGIKIKFIDNENKVTEAQTDIFGYFSLELEPKKYSIILNDHTLLLTENLNKIYDFKNEKKEVFLSLEAIFKNGFISGRTVDNFNNPIPFSKLRITSREFFKNIISDEFGYFSLEVPHGILRISSFSEGFLTKSIVKNLPPASAIPNISIIMNKIFHSLEGYVTDGVEPLENIEVKLFSEKGSLLKRVSTSETGKFFFSDIPSLEKIYIVIESQNYIIYNSELIKLEKNIKNFYIPLVKTVGKTY